MLKTLLLSLVISAAAISQQTIDDIAADVRSVLNRTVDETRQRYISAVNQYKIFSDVSSCANEVFVAAGELALAWKIHEQKETTPFLMQLREFLALQQNSKDSHDLTDSQDRVESNEFLQGFLKDIMRTNLNNKIDTNYHPHLLKSYVNAKLYHSFVPQEYIDSPIEILGSFNRQYSRVKFLNTGKHTHIPYDPSYQIQSLYTYLTALGIPGLEGTELL